MKISATEVMWLRRPRVTIGSLLVDAGVMDDAGRRRVLQEQGYGLRRFGELAVALGLASRRHVQDALWRQFKFDEATLASHPDVLAPELVAVRDAYGLSAEPLRVVRSQLMLRWLDRPVRRNALAIVSHDRREGRSHLAANLAASFALAGEMTLLIDADLRHPRQQAMFGLREQGGLSAYLADPALEQPLSPVSQVPGLYVLQAGPVPPNPAELFGRGSWRELLLRAQGAFDVVIVDTPALGRFDETALIAAGLGSALVVARSHVTRTARLRDSIRGLHHMGVEVVGTVLNDMPAKEGT